MNKEIRKLVSFKEIDEIRPIDGADNIEVATVGGWNAVVNKNKFKAGQKIVYFEIDSFLPKNVEAFAFLMKRSLIKTINDKNETVEGHVLKTIRLRGQFSQGLILGIDDFDDLDSKIKDKDEETSQQILEDFVYNDLGVFKYEASLPMNDFIKDNYPDFTRKTDSVRVQNLKDDYLALLAKSSQWFASEKIDGTSSTWWKDKDGTLNVASRNYTLDINKSPLHLAISKKYRLDEILRPGDIIKCEIYGNGIQSNPLQLRDQRLALFDYENSEGLEISKELEMLRAPIYDLEFPKTVEQAVKQADKLKSKINENKYAEGIVWWSKEHKIFNKLGNRPNFKVINNTYLLKHDK